MKISIALTISTLIVSACATPSQMIADAEVKRLCAIDGGIKVYETVRLPAEKFDKWGNIYIPSKDKAANMTEFYFEREQSILISGNPSVIRTVHRIIRQSDGKILGTSIRYGRGGGDIPGPWHPSSFICPEISKETPSVESSIFIKGEEK